MEERQDLVRRLQKITRKLSDNRKQIIIISRKKEKSVTELENTTTKAARNIGNKQRRMQVKRQEEPITYHHSFGGRSPLPSHKCRQAPYHDTRNVQEMSGTHYKRKNGFIAHHDACFYVGENIVMDTKGKHTKKHIKRATKSKNRQYKQEATELRRRQQEKGEQQKAKSELSFGFRTSPYNFTYPPPPPHPSPKEDIIASAVKKIIAALTNQLTKADITKPRGQPKDDNDPKYQEPPMTKYAKGNGSRYDKVYDDDDDDDDNSIEIIKVYDSDSDSDRHPPQPRKREWARTATISSEPPLNSSFQRFRRLLSRPQAIPPSEDIIVNDVDTSTIRPNNITVGIESSDTSLQLPNSNLSPMSVSIQIPPTESLPTERLRAQNEEPKLPINIPGLNINQSRTLISILNHMETMSPSGDIKAIMEEFEKMGTTVPNQLANNPCITQEFPLDTEGESDEQSNTSDTSHLHNISNLLRDGLTNRKKLCPEEKLSKGIARLTKKLLDTASRMKLKMFRKEEILLQRRRKFIAFVHSITPILRIDRKTQGLLKEWPLFTPTNFPEAKAAFYSLLHAYVDDNYRSFLHRHPDDGNAGFIALNAHCAQNTAEDRATYSRLFLSIYQGPQESAYQYIERFNTALEMATLVGNSYEDNYITDLLIHGFGTQQRYISAVSMLKESRRRDEITKTTTVTRSSIESAFAQIDEHHQRRHNTFTANFSHSTQHRDRDKGKGRGHQIQGRSNGDHRHNRYNEGHQHQGRDRG
ncbi:MAG: hypothetical protein ACREBR_03090, partial [bacterium]